VDIEFSTTDIEAGTVGNLRDALGIVRNQVIAEASAVSAPSGTDDVTADAPCWVARDTLGVPIGAACVDGGHCYIAVVPDQRRRRLGSTLLRLAIDHGLKRGRGAIDVKACPEHTHFFWRAGFVPTIAPGVAAADVAAPDTAAHSTATVLLTLAMQRFAHPRPVTPPRPVSEDERRRQPLRDIAEFGQAAEALAGMATRKLCVLTEVLDPRIYATAAFLRAVVGFVLGRRDAEVQVLVGDPRALVQGSHSLLRLSRRLPSRIRIRRRNPSYPSPYNELMLIDGAGALCNQSTNGYHGYAIRHSPQDVAALTRGFDTLWAVGEADPELRLMSV